MLDYVQFFRIGELESPKMLRKKSSTDAPTGIVEKENKTQKHNSSIISRHLSFSGHKQKDQSNSANSKSKSPSCDNQSPLLQRSNYVNCTFDEPNHVQINIRNPKLSYANMGSDGRALFIDSPEGTPPNSVHTHKFSGITDIRELPNCCYTDAPEVVNPNMNYVMLDLRPSNINRNRPLSIDIPESYRRPHYSSSCSFQENDPSPDEPGSNSASVSPNLNYVQIFPECPNKIQSISVTSSLKSLDVLSNCPKTNKDSPLEYVHIDFEKTLALNGALEEFESQNEPVQTEIKTSRTSSKKRFITRSFRSIGKKRESTSGI